MPPLYLARLGRLGGFRKDLCYMSSLCNRPPLYLAWLGRLGGTRVELGWLLLLLVFAVARRLLAAVLVPAVARHSLLLA